MLFAIFTTFAIFSPQREMREDRESQSQLLGFTHSPPPPANPLPLLPVGDCDYGGTCIFYVFFVTKIPSRMGEQMALLVMAAVGDHVVMVVVKVVRKSRSDAEFQCAVVMEQATGDQGRGA